MKLDFFILADAAAAADGKLYVHGGGVRDFTVPVIPWTQPSLAFVFRMTFDPDDLLGSHDVAVQVMSKTDDAIIVGPANALIDPTTFPPLEKGATKNRISFALTIGGIPFPAVGKYAAQVMFDGDVVAEEPLIVQLDETSSEGFVPLPQPEQQ